MVDISQEDMPPKTNTSSVSSSSGEATPSPSPSSPVLKAISDATNKNISIDTAIESITTKKSSNIEQDSTTPSSVKPKKRKGKRASAFQVLRLVFVGLTFVTGCLAIVTSQLFIILLYSNDPVKKQELLEFTKKNFVILVTFITSITTPTTLIFTIENEKLQSKLLTVDSKTGHVYFHLEPSAIIIANHQIYSDWLFLWYLAYMNNNSEQFFIIMKKSLESIPILGYGMKNYDFIFLNRNWAVDKSYMIDQFNRLNKKNPLKHWLLIFPEGTNLSANTRGKSDKFAEKIGYTDKLKHILLPRVKVIIPHKNMLKISLLYLEFTYLVKVQPK
ncbi:unnamed protein product [Ambrosiozyma monospora]|uniref:Unnamed protein product n=1 Tax=Ambrosiozyma monospora TaxID=43982 RepID=A0A9W7DLI4_AMBMO|nr:unnamed protein product [Ambrosiozyma monospora]